MKFSTNGIGWLIAGGLICASAFETDGVSGAVSTVMIGLVFAAVYFMKQRFEPVGKGWFIAGGIMLAFSVDTLIDVLGGVFRNRSSEGDDLSTLLFGLILSGAFLMAFYKKNQTAINDFSVDMGVDVFPQPEDAGCYEAEPVVAAETIVEEPSEKEGEVIDFDIDAK